jgi:hypothetical protein
MQAEAKNADKAQSAQAGQAAPAEGLRSNFAETAFWVPQLLTGADGSATLELTTCSRTRRRA